MIIWVNVNNKTHNVTIEKENEGNILMVNKILSKQKS